MFSKAGTKVGYGSVPDSKHLWKHVFMQAARKAHFAVLLTAGTELADGSKISELKKVLSKISRPLFARLSWCAAFSISEPFWNTRDLYSRAFLWAQHFLSASHSEKLTNSIRATCFVPGVFYLRDILKKSRSLFARLSLSAASCFFWVPPVCPMKHINCSSLHLPAIVHGGERYFVTRRPSVSWICGPKTLCLTNQLFGLGAPSF